jgi:dGTPase
VSGPPSWLVSHRERRRHNVASRDQRSPFERDRDRVLYSSAFRRLSGITQIVRAGESDVFHTRQQHTLKVAQVGLRISQKLESRQADASAFHGLHHEVVEAACLAHDLGHPPFGHVAEWLLDKLVLDAGDKDGFEGNAQTFRIVTKLSVRYSECDGLDLTRATLCACLKYPWLRDTSRLDRTKKWGAYSSERDDFRFARESFLDDSKSAEAEIMDWADDIAYSVHDVEDFHRVNVIPWTRIFDGDQFESTVERAAEAWFQPPDDAAGRLREAIRNLKTVMALAPSLVNQPYEGSRDQRQQLRSLTSALIGRYLNAITLVEKDSYSAGTSRISIEESAADEVRVLKQIARDHIIHSPALVAQQHGQQRIIKNLFRWFSEDSKDSIPAYLPRRLNHLWDMTESRARFAADAICSMTEAEAVALHGRLSGSSSGSVLDPIIR